VEISIERRNSRRFQITLPLLFRWNDGIAHYNAGKSVNIGQGGMFLIATNIPPMGTDVELEFVLPAFDSVPRPTRLHCIGLVSRTETCCQVAGFAIAGRFENVFEAKADTPEPVESLDVGT
jgi:hypothetical protein